MSEEALIEWLTPTAVGLVAMLFLFIFLSAFCKGSPNVHAHERLKEEVVEELEDPDVKLQAEIARVEHEKQLRQLEAEMEAQQAAASKALSVVEAAEAAYRDAQHGLAAAKLNAQLQYSQSLEEGLDNYKLDKELDAAAAQLSHQEAMRNASAAYARELQEAERILKAAGEALWVAKAPERALQEVQAAVERQQASVERAAVAARVARLQEQTSEQARLEAAARANAIIREKKARAHQEALLLTDSSGSNKMAVKPPLPRQTTVARSYLYGEPALELRHSGTGTPGFAWWTSSASAQSSDAEADTRMEATKSWSLWDSKKADSNSKKPETPSARKPRSPSRLGAYPRGVNNVYPHRLMLEVCDEETAVGDTKPTADGSKPSARWTFRRVRK